MSRLVILAFLMLPAVAPAQGFSVPYRTGSSFYQQAYGRYPGGFAGVYSPMVRVPSAVPYRGIGYLSPGGFYDPGFYTLAGSDVYYIPSFAGESAQFAAAAPVPLAPAGVPTPSAKAPVADGRPAQLRLDLPAPADLWVDGELAPNRSSVYNLTSPPVAAGGRHTFRLKATWTADGTKYEWERAVTVAASGRSRVAVTAGFKAKD